MTLDHALREWLRAELAAAIPAVLADLVHQSRLVALADTGINHRAILAAERARELQVYRRGHSAFVERSALEAWIIAGKAPAKLAPPSDEIGELLAANDARRARRTRSA